MAQTPTRQFDFGQNWLEYSRSALSPERARQAERDFLALLRDVPLAGRTFLDIGFGQGLGLLTATQAGARTAGCDINPKCAEALHANQPHFPGVRLDDVPVVVGSILDPAVVARLRPLAPGGFDVVHSWGVLHHTGDMERAIEHACSLVAPRGHLVLALYNRHWSSRPWLWIKWLYVHCPRPLQRAAIALLYPVIYAAKWLVTGRNPRTKDRGMDFYYDVVDWVGGYPYEYASIDEVHRLLAGRGFDPMLTRKAEVPTGCNEFVFRRRT